MQINLLRIIVLKNGFMLVQNYKTDVILDLVYILLYLDLFTINVDNRLILINNYSSS